MTAQEEEEEGLRGPSLLKPFDAVGN
eukprot:COSAG02_NODE_14356_length_1280_cov_24.558848_1_plen_25_part_10